MTYTEFDVLSTARGGITAAFAAIGLLLQGSCSEMPLLIEAQTALAQAGRSLDAWEAGDDVWPVDHLTAVEPFKDDT